ncbi:hypothetical protein MMC24_002162 [Lignoscripta atroalba]|nr:hypothetical protein [Lignoscripta atroalba]
MAPTQKLYPRATVKKIIKAHSKRNVSKSVDILIFLDYTLFLQDLIREASIHAKKNGEKSISAGGVKKVTEVSVQMAVEVLHGIYAYAIYQGEPEEIQRMNILYTGACFNNAVQKPSSKTDKTFPIRARHILISTEEGPRCYGAVKPVEEANNARHYRL